MRIKLSLCLVVALSFITHTLSAQVTLKETPIKQQVNKSSLIIEGKVVSKESFWNKDNGLIYASNTVEVYKVFKGQLITKVDVITVGGTVGLRALIANPSLKLNIDDIGSFMLENTDIVNTKQKYSNKQFKPYGSLQGFYKYNLRDDIVVSF